MSNENLLAQLQKISDSFQPAVTRGVKKATREILRESVSGMKRFSSLIRIGRDGKPYYTVPNRTNTLRVLTGDLKDSLLAASEGSNLSGGIFKSRMVGDDYELLFGSTVVDEAGESYPNRHDHDRFAFLRHRVEGSRYMKSIVEEVNKEWR